MKRVILIWAFVCFLVEITNAQSTIKAIRISTPPVIDGFVNDKVWEEAFLVNEFTQREPNLGAPVSDRTEFLTCY